MRCILATLLAILMFTPELPARSSHDDWNKVMKLKSGTPVLISLWNGERLGGRIESVTDAGVELDDPDRSSAHGSWQRQIDRSSIQQIARTHEAHLPNPRKWMAIGAAGGAGTAITVGAITEPKATFSGKWLLDGFAGAVLGFIGSCVVVAIVSTGALVRNTHQNRIIYESPGPPPGVIAESGGTRLNQTTLPAGPYTRN